MPERPIHPAALDDDALLALCDFGRSRGSGPGGQHRNKVETRIELTHIATGISAVAGERRSIRENRPVAIRRLRLALATHHRVGVPTGEIRSELWRSRTTKAGQIVCSTKHRDFATMLAEAMDVIDAARHDMDTASLRLCCSKSQLLKLVKDHPPAFVLLNEERERRGLRRLR